MLIMMAGIWFFMGYRSNLDGESNNRNTIIVSILMVAGIIFYVMYPKIQLLFRSGAIIITNTGITDFTIPLGFIPWTELLKVNETKESFSPLVRKVRIIELDLKNPEHYLVNLNGFRSQYFRIRETKGKTIFYFDLRYVKETDFKLIDKIQEYLTVNKYKSI